MSTEEPPDGAAPPPTPEPPAAAPPPDEGAPPPVGQPSQRALIIGAAVVVIVLVVAFALSQMGTAGSGNQPQAYVVQPYKPQSQLISARDRVVAYQRPDVHSASVVMFGQGIALDVTGRVSRGLASNWYAIAWNGGIAFVRQQDAIAGTPTAPPITAPRVPPLPPRDDIDTSDQEIPDAEAPTPPVQSGPPDLTGVRWLHRPTQRDFRNAFPRRALMAGEQGHVTLACTATGGGRLECSIEDESPRGYGFGRAALDLARKFRIEPVTPDGRSVAGGRIELPIEFRQN